jgi:uncharacterized membrane protein
MALTCLRLSLYLLCRRRATSVLVGVAIEVDGGVEDETCTYVANIVSRRQVDVACFSSSLEERTCHHHLFLSGMSIGAL